MSPLRQHIGFPLFSSDSSKQDLLCSQCLSSILIKGYNPDNFIDIAIQCANCCGITVTPRLEDGEILPRSFIVCHSSSDPNSSPTRHIDAETAVISNAQLAREQKLNHPRPPYSVFEKSIASLLRLEAEYDAISQGALQKQKKALQTYSRLGNFTAGLHKYPFAWSCGRFRRMIRLNSPVMPVTDYGDAAALTRAC